MRLITPDLSLHWADSNLQTLYADNRLALEIVWPPQVGQAPSRSGLTAFPTY